MNNILLKRATLKDIEEITKLEKEASSKTYVARINTNDLKCFIENDFVFFIKHKSIVVGIVAYQVLKRKIAHFHCLVIDKKFRNKGFGKQAMRLILKRMPKYSRIELVVHPLNSRAISIYLSLGFIIEACHNNHFGDGEPRLVLAKK